MHRTIRLATTMAAMTLAALLLLACNGGPPPPTDSPTATTTPPASPTPSSTPRQTPTPITATPTAFPTLPPLLRPLVPEPATPELATVLSTSDPLVIVSGEASSEHFDGRSWPTIAVVTLDSAGDQQARLEFGEVARYPHRWDLAGDEVIVAFEHAIVRYRLDGTIATVLRPESEFGYQSLLLSPDSSRIVFAEFGDPRCGVACIVFADAMTGVELGRVFHSGTSLEQLQRFANPSHWRGSDTVLVRGSPNGHTAHGLATVHLDGTIEVHPTEPNGTFSPSGDQILRLSGMIAGYDEPLNGCGFPTALDIYDVDSAAVSASSRDINAGISDLLWSPDGTQVLVERKPLPDPDQIPCREAYPVWFQSPSTWSLLDIDTGIESSVATPDEVVSSWHGGRWADLICLEATIAGARYSDGHRRARCLCPDLQLVGQTTVRLDGAPIATGPYDRVLGVLLPSTQLTSDEIHALPPDTRFGEPGVDAIVDALLAADVNTVIDVIEWEQSACVTNWTGGFPSPAPCAASEVDGTLVDSLTLGGGETQQARPDAIRALLERELPRNRTLCELQTRDDGKRVVRLRLASVYRGQPTGAVTDDLTVAVIDGRIVSIGNLVESVHRDSARCHGVRDLTTE